MKIAAADGVFGEKIKVDSVFNCLVNDQGNETILTIFVKMMFSRLKDSNID